MFRPLVAGLLAVPAAVALATAPAAATPSRPYTDAAFMAAQKAGKPILIEVHAPWCPICAAQDRAIASVSVQNPDLVRLRIDFDTQKPLWQKFGAQKQSTLIAYRGKRETGRLSYSADAAAVAKLLASTRD